MLVLAKFAKDKPAVLGAIIVLLIAVVAILAPLLAPYPADVSASHLLRRLKPPSWARNLAPCVHIGHHLFFNNVP